MHIPAENSEEYPQLEGGGGGVGGGGRHTFHYHHLEFHLRILRIIESSIWNSFQYKKTAILQEVFDPLEINFSKNRRDDPDAPDCMTEATESIFTRLNHGHAK